VLKLVLLLLLLLLQVCLAQGSSVNSVLDVRVGVNTGTSLLNRVVLAMHSSSLWVNTGSC
jgi:hypothetical protein